MSIETGRFSDKSDSQRRIDELSYLTRLEGEGVHVDTLAHQIDPTIGHELSSEIDTSHQKTQEVKKTFAQRTRIRAQRKRRMNAQRLMRGFR